jgi:hypothetical protein
MEGLNWQTVQLPLAAGVNQQADDRALAAPSLLIAKDVQFDEDGGLQTRHPFAASASSDIFGGGTISNARRLVQNRDERLLFTKDTLYSWNAQLSKWVSRATHLAINVEEEPVFVTTGDQTLCDRAELNSTIVYCWTEVSGSSTRGYAAAIDKDTGSVLMAPTALAAASTRLRVTALTTKILLTYYDGSTGLFAYALDPAAPATALAGASTTVTNTNYGAAYDIAKVPGADQAVFASTQNPNTSYTVGTITAGLTVASSSKGRTCDGPIAVAPTTDGASVQIARGNGVDVQGDLITISTRADVYTAQALGSVAALTTIYQITAAYASATTCYVFWQGGQSVTSHSFLSEYNTVTTSNSVGSEAALRRGLGVASRAFAYDSSVYLWMVFAGESNFSGAGSTSFRAQLQNTYFLYKHDGTLCAKAGFVRAGGFTAQIGALPNVALTSGSTTFSWCGTERRIVPTGELQTGYSDRGPRDITFTFDSNEARRTTRLGQTLYVTGGEILQYDGRDLTEIGFHVYPWSFAAIEVAAGNLTDGVYTYQQTFRWDNAKGERERSTSATTGQVTIAGGPNGVSIVDFAPSRVTHKTNVTNEFWRTPVNPPADSPFYLVTSQDPSVTSNPNRYLVNDPTGATTSTFNDELVDTTLITKESNPENGGVLENLAPPPATIIAAYGSRVFLGGVAGEPRRIWYSKQRNEGEVVAFHDVLTFELPLEGGDLVALGFLDGTLVAFCETSTFIVPGDGFDNLGQGANYGPARAVSYDVGCRDHDSVATTPMGLVFQSNKGKYLLNRGFALTYIGGPVSDHDSETVLACHVDEKRHHVRWLTASRMLVWDYKARSQDNQGQWAEWTITDGVHAAVLGGTYHYLTSTGSKALGTAYTSMTYGLDTELAWIKPADLQGFSRIRHMMLLGEYRSAHYVRVRISYNYSDTVVDDRAWTVSPTTVGGPLQVKIFPTRQQCQAIKLRLTAVAASTIATASGLSAVVALSVGNWTATLTSVVPRSFAIWFLDGATASVEVRDNELYNGTTWVATSGCCGVLVTGRNTTAPVTIATVEAAINASSALVSVTSAHGTPSSTINFTTMAGTGTTAAAFAAASPTGEALKLTGLALEVGFKRGTHRRLPAAQRT